MKHTILVFTFLCMLEGTLISAARCGARRGVAEELEHATVVFSGKAIAAEYRPIAAREGLWPEGSEVLAIKFSVERWWKGSFDSEVILQTWTLQLPHGYTKIFGGDFRFVVGEEYLVYASGPIESLSTDSCTRTVKLENAEEDLRALGEGWLPEEKMQLPLPPTDKPLQLTPR